MRSYSVRVSRHPSYATGLYSTIAYSSDAIYLYSTRDNPEPTSMGSRESSLIPPNNKRQKLSEDVDDGNDTLASDTEMSQDRAERDALMEEDIERMLSEESPSSRPRRELRPLLSDDMDEDDPDVREEDEEDEDEDEDNSHGDERYAKVPTIMPRSRFEGICNVETVKDGVCCALDPPFMSDILTSELSWTTRRICSLWLRRRQLVHVGERHWQVA